MVNLELCCSHVLPAQNYAYQLHRIYIVDDVYLDQIYIFYIFDFMQLLCMYTCLDLDGFDLVYIHRYTYTCILP